MRLVSAADGSVPEELLIIDAFEDGVPGAPVTEVDFSLFQVDPVRRVFLGSVALVAIADGRVSEPELEILRGFARRVGADDAMLQATLRDVSQYLLSTFAGVHHFRDEAVAIGQGLGLSDADIDMVLAG